MMRLPETKANYGTLFRGSLACSSAGVFRGGFSNPLGTLSLVAAVYLVFVLTVFGPFLIVRDTDYALQQAGVLSEISSGGHASVTAAYSTRQLIQGEDEDRNTPANSISKRIRGAIESKDSVDKVFGVFVSWESLTPGVAAISVHNALLLESPPKGSLLTYDLLQRPPPGE